MKILITGTTGYIGYPLCLQLLQSKEHQLIGIDNDSRNVWTQRVAGVVSYSTDIVSTDYIQVIEDLTSRDLVNELLLIHRPDCIIHLASQPSMPYSQINGERALYTQVNNLSMCINLLWGLKENGIKCKFILCSTTGIPGQAYKEIPETATRNMAGSWYHISRGFDSDNCSLASRQWNQEIIELRTSIVYGIQTELMKRQNLVTRFDTDPYFGTALNRFVNQALKKKPITIYGKGEQIKPFISLEDTVQSIVNALTYETTSRHEIFNQVTEHTSVNDLAEMIKTVLPDTVIEHIPNPRKELEDFKMTFINDKFLKLLNKKPQTMKEGITDLINYFTNKSYQINHSSTYTA